MSFGPLVWLSVYYSFSILLHITVVAAASDFATVYLVDPHGKSVGVRELFDKYVSRMSDMDMLKPNWAGLIKCFGHSGHRVVIETLEISKMQIVHSGTADCPVSSKEICDFVHLAVPDKMGYHRHSCISDSSAPKLVPTAASITPTGSYKLSTMLQGGANNNCPLHYPPNDPLFHQQAALYEALRVERAWSLTDNCRLPRRDVVIGVLDTGILEDYPDLIGKVLDGYDASGVPISSLHDNYGHGTAMTSIVGSIIGNDFGTAGIVDKVKFRPIRLTSDEHGRASTSQFMRGLEGALLGFDDIDILLIAYADKFTYDEQDALSDILRSREDILVITSGMSADSTTRHPTQLYLPCRLHRYFNNVICAIATETDQPDVLVYNSTLDATLGVPSTDVMAPFIVDGEWDLIPVTGSSASAAITAGVAALMMSFDVLTPTDVKNILVTTTDKKARTKDERETDVGVIRPDLAVQRAIARATPRTSRTSYKMLRTRDNRKQKHFSPIAPGRNPLRKK
ncbi:hypothetical protein FOL47_000666 [Perkinsus chesapeaki]|uniref:subtilisin n=1 Tax=Perkinsus chesapeaki TaxID=330153 RepID=A0A7J6ML79_PERCH|nr:hypothetical protein FOL47_000666 [Perkinsus chesapeaki]